MSLSNSVLFTKGGQWNQKSKLSSLSSSLTKTDSPLQCLFEAQQEKIPFELPMCENCFHLKKNEMDREEVNYTCTYCEVLKMLDDLEELTNLDEMMKQEEIKVKKLEEEIGRLRIEQNNLKEEKEIVISIQNKFKEEHEKHSDLLTEIIKVSLNSFDRFQRIDIQSEKEITKQYEDNIWNKIHRIEWTENGILFGSINIVLDYQKAKYDNVAVCFKLILKECLLLRQMLRTQLTKCSIITGYSKFAMTKSTISYLDFTQRSVKKVKKFTQSLNKLSIVLEELTTIVMLQFNQYKPLYKIVNFTANGLSLSPTSSQWPEAIKYFLSEFKHLREFVLKIVN